MSAMHWHLKIAGAGLLCLFVVHSLLPLRFSWKKELGAVSLLTRQVFFVHHFFIGLTVVMMGVVSLFFTAILVQPNLPARVVLFGLCLFWFARLVVQLFVYDSRLWRGNPRRTFAHIMATGLWIYLVCVYGGAFWQVT